MTLKPEQEIYLKELAASQGYCDNNILANNVFFMRAPGPRPIRCLKKFLAFQAEFNYDAYAWSLFWVNRIYKGFEKVEDHGGVADLHEGVADLP